MKILFVFMFTLCSSLALANVTKTCEMSARGNKTTIIISAVSATKATVQMDTEEADICDLEASSQYDLLARCGDAEDATYFGVKGSSGRVFEASGKIADLKKCR
jgi:hypothetical protein